MNEKVKEYIKLLDGISLAEWDKLKTAIDITFNSKQKELDKDIKLDTETANKMYKYHFGE